MRPIRISLFVLTLIVFIQSCKKSDNPSNPSNPPSTPSCIANNYPGPGAFVLVGNNISLSWNTVSGATGYDVYLGTSATNIPLLASNVSTNATNYTVPATANTVYYWYVVPKNANGSATGCTSNVTSFTAITIQAPAQFGYYVVGYFPSYRNLSDVPDIKFRMCNVINYSFFTVTANGDAAAPASPAASPAAVIAKARLNNAKVFMGINDGSGDGKTYFKNMASTAMGRNRFVADVMNKVRQYGFDGVDIDWEYPSTSDGTDVTFTELMRELSDSLHRDARYYLSAALTPGKYAGSIRDAIKSQVFGYGDIFNIMAYDDFSTTAPYKQHSDYNLAVTCLNYWLTTRGMPKEKCVLGFPAYGRPSGITQSGTILTYRDIISRGGSSQSDSAVVTNGGFTNYTIYYNGQPTVKKKAILAKQIANGVMVWEKWEDTHDGTSLLKAACDTVGRVY